MKYTLVTGCSLTDGTGLSLGKQDPDLWVNIFFDQINKTQQTTLLNLATPGRSNAGIFADTAENLFRYDCKYAFVTWTSMPRYELDLGLELYYTKQMFAPNAFMLDHRLNQLNYSSDYLSNICNRFTMLAHLHHEIVQLVRYTNILIEIATRTNTKIFFINSACPWDRGFFDFVENTLPSDYTEFTKQLIGIETRSDDEIFQLYKKMHDDYQQHNGIQEHSWLNLYRSFRTNAVDFSATAPYHPGEKTNKLVAEDLYQSFSSKI
jgi:hypothetical protein